jgi:hypothetical protein
MEELLVREGKANAPFSVWILSYSYRREKERCLAKE